MHKYWLPVNPCYIVNYSTNCLKKLSHTESYIYNIIHRVGRKQSMEPHSMKKIQVLGLKIAFKTRQMVTDWEMHFDNLQGT